MEIIQTRARRSAQMAAHSWDTVGARAARDQTDRVRALGSRGHSDDVH